MSQCVHLLCVFLEINLCLGLRDPLFSSVGGVPRRVLISEKEDDPRGKCGVIFNWKECGKDDYLITHLNDEDGFRVTEGATYNLVRCRSILHPDPHAIEWRR